VKRRNGEALSPAEVAALKRYERKSEEAALWKFYETIPATHFRELTGKTWKELKSAARRHGIPFDAKTVNLREFLPAVFARLEELLNQKPPDVEHISLNELARIMGVKRQSVSELDCPKNPDGSYNLPAVIRWKLRHTEEMAMTPPRGDTEVLARWRLARARIAELELAQMEGELVPAAEVKTAWAELLVSFRNRLLGLPSKLAKDLENQDAPTIHSTLTGALHRILKELSITTAIYLPGLICPLT